MFVEVNGTKLYVDIEGCGLVPDGPTMKAKPTLILLHGGPGFDHTLFKPAFSVLSSLAQIVYFDQRGNGRSMDSDPATWNLAQWGDDVKGLCDVLGIERPIVYGASFGGFVAQSYAVRHPDHPAKLILASTAARVDFTAVFAAFERLGGKHARDIAEAYWSNPTVESRTKYFEVCLPLYRSRSIADPDAQRRAIVSHDVAIRFNGPRNEHGRMDFRAQLRRVRCPVLIMAGDRDPITPIAFSETIVESLPAHLARFERFPGCGHGVSFEDPERFFALVREFIMTDTEVEAFAQSPSEVTVNVFPGGFNWGIYVAQERGLFAKNGIRVTVQATPNSVAQMTGLSEGKFDIAMTAVDNIVAYVEGQGEAPIGPQPEFFAFMGSDTAFLSLVTAPDVKAVADLKGRTLSVDALTTGYAFVLFEILRRGGLNEGDYQVAKVGGMVQRFNALRERKQDGTMLSTPYNTLAKADGFTQLAAATKVIGSYQGNVAAARRSWAAANKDKVVGYIRAYVEAIDWLYDRANRQEAVRILRKNLPQMPQHLAERTYDEMLDPQDGFFRGGRMDMAGLKTVLELRSRYGKPAKNLADPMKYYDPTYHTAAIGK